MGPRSKEEQLELHKKAVKLMAALQVCLEIMDELKYTTVYKHKIKMNMNRLEEEIERYLFDPLKTIDTVEKEETFLSVQKSIAEIIETNVEELFLRSETKLK